jgi:hypothetical protein
VPAIGRLGAATGRGLPGFYYPILGYAGIAWIMTFSLFTVEHAPMLVQDSLRKTPHFEAASWSTIEGRLSPPALACGAAGATSSYRRHISPRSMICQSC